MLFIRIAAIAVAGILAVTTSACSRGKETASPPPLAPGEAAAAKVVELKTGSTPLGLVVTNTFGRTVYVYIKDKAGSGKSSCYGACATKWPPVFAAKAKPKSENVTGKVGIITRTGGARQVTLEGHPLYLYQEDTKVGGTTGQNRSASFFVVRPTGELIK